MSFFIGNAQWTKGKGNGYYKLSFWYLESDKHFTDTGKTDPNVTRGQVNASFYGAYGITNKLDAIVYFPFFSSTYENDVISGTTGETISSGETVNSIGDIDIAVRLKLLKTKRLALSTSLVFGLPTGNSQGGSDGSFQTGDGEFNQLLKVNLGTPFKLLNAPFYAKTYVGFNNRTNGFSDEFRTGLEIGGNFFNRKIWLIARSQIVESMQNGSLNAQNSQGSIFANNIEYTNIGGEIAYYITKKLGVSLNYTHPISGRIIYANASISGGIFFDVK
ncbi:hypothetical protein PK35_15655 [Tamlana nanhaiensis]|uniref:Uncharacterized protein n=2 Tax=Neotamlana nanhaiensis TaxID=1382798 RepID=A0A0D7VXX4_9FLAO|nr:hypothetical protein PK35_15655 [Tamlana nanhaiensis]